MMRRGLRAVKAHTGSLRHKALVDLFKANFGAHPKHAARVWRDLLESNIVLHGEEDLLGFFAALSFLRVYAKEKIRRSLFDMNEKPLRVLTWKWLHLIPNFIRNFLRALVVAATERPSWPPSSKSTTSKYT